MWVNWVREKDSLLVLLESMHCQMKKIIDWVVVIEERDAEERGGSGVEDIESRGSYS